MKKIFKYIPMMLAVLALASCQDNDEESFANKASINSTEMRAETIIKGDADVVKTLNITMPRPAEKIINATFVTAPSLVSTYNQAYGANAVLLPEEYYNVVNGKVTVDAGSVKSTDATFEFTGLGNLDRDLVYVLPVEVKTEDIALVNSASRFYFVFRAGALINVVTNMSRNYLTVQWADKSQVNNMSQITMEALIYPREFGKLISTVMGIEGSFLMRIGDAGYPDNQIQIATSSGNFPASDSNKGLATKAWQHVALTLDCNTREYKIYVNGRLQSEGTHNVSSVNIQGNGTDRDFLIGKSYDNNRWFEGDMSEVRVWNVVRTQEEIAAHFYTVDPATPGLIGYWKMDDNTSAYKVVDATGHGNDAYAADALSWRNVSLPE